MPFRPVTLPSPLVLVPGASSLYSQLQALADREGFPRSPYDIANDLNILNAAGGVPITLSEPLPNKTDWSVLAHTRRYLVRLFVTKKYADAYTIASIAPLRLRDHQRLAQGCLLVRPRKWLAVNSPQEIPQGTASGWNLITREWAGLGASLAISTPPTGPQDAFLGTLGGVIDATERITADSDSGQSYPYRGVKPTAGRRSGATQLYEFTLAGARVPDEGEFVQVAAASDRAKARGQITRVNDMTVTIWFDEAVDWNQLQGQGEITTMTKTIVYRMQREAVGQFRSGRARNPGVLDALLNRRAQPPGADQRRHQPPRPAFRLNRHQREAFDKTLARPDVLAVIGPPGTGKTTTIAEIVQASAGSGEHVIICSQNNRAVDNVLGRMSAELLAIRVGNELRVTPEGIPYLLQRQAADLRGQALRTSRRNLDAYAGLGQAQAWADELARRNAALAAARGSQAQALTRLEDARRAAGGSAAEEVDLLAGVQATREQDAQRRSDRMERIRQLGDRAKARSSWAVIGWIFALLARRWAGKYESARIMANTLAAALREADAELQAAQRRLVVMTKDVPAVIRAKEAADTAGAQVGREHAAALRAFRSASETLVPMGVEPPSVRDKSDDSELAAAGQWLTERLPLLKARRDLLDQWVEEASGESDQLHPELIRYAHVLAATCTGAGSRPELADLDFDLAIVDEAGQIGIADALIPLARATRAVLVGDHMQLPPFLDSDVEAWGRLVGDPVVRGILAKSALEMVVEALPPDSPNVVWLTEQRRMPEVIARFASATFYGGRLETPPGLREHRDRLFRSPLAFVDTSALEWAKRRDRSGRDRERWGQQGYDNPGEARLLADLAMHYDHAHQDWAVIVPYLAQAELIRRLLTGQAGDAETVRLNVGTVDSFQGGERDVILYGFTRSNPERRVGFLRELRRVNVAITRARQQLVLVGDLDTLTSATDQGFRELATSLRDYVAGSGEILPYGAARSRLLAERTER